MAPPDKPASDARRMRVWILLLQNHPTQALKEIDLLGKELQRELGDKAAPERLTATIRFVGQAFAYLEGPSAGGVKAEMVTKSKEAFLKQLKGDGQQVFRAGFDDGRQRLGGNAENSVPSETSQADAENRASLKNGARTERKKGSRPREAERRSETDCCEVKGIGGEVSRYS